MQPESFDGNIRFGPVDFMNSAHKDRAGWVLTGGRSSRMGFDKALAELAGQPMALVVADHISGICGSVSLVGDPAKYGMLGLPVISDTYPDMGPLAGIEAVLRHTSAAWNLIVACDMPALDAALLESLFTACDAGGTDGAVPTHDGKPEPLCAVYHRRCHSAVHAALLAGVRKVTDGLRSCALNYIRMPSRAPFANLNTPREFEAYQHG